MNNIVLLCYAFLESMLLRNNLFFSFMSWLNLLSMFFFNNVFYLLLLGNQTTIFLLILHMNRFMFLCMRLFFDLRIFKLIFLWNLFFGFDFLCSRFFDRLNISNGYIMVNFFLKYNLLLRLHFILLFFFFIFPMFNFLNFLMMLFFLFCLNMLLCLLLLIIKMLKINCLFDFRINSQRGMLYCLFLFSSWLLHIFHIFRQYYLFIVLMCLFVSILLFF